MSWSADDVRQMSEVVKGSKELQKRSSSNRETDAVGTSTAQAVTDKAIDVSDIQVVHLQSIKGL
jgi:hypothetical protein